jgi:hypothetical protein
MNFINTNCGQNSEITIFNDVGMYTYHNVLSFQHADTEIRTLLQGYVYIKYKSS